MPNNVTGAVHFLAYPGRICRGLNSLVTKYQPAAPISHSSTEFRDAVCRCSATATAVLKMASPSGEFASTSSECRTPSARRNSQRRFVTGRSSSNETFPGWCADVSRRWRHSVSGELFEYRVFPPRRWLRCNERIALLCKANNAFINRSIRQPDVSWAPSIS